MLEEQATSENEKNEQKEHPFNVFSSKHLDEILKEGKAISVGDLMDFSRGKWLDLFTKNSPHQEAQNNKEKESKSISSAKKENVEKREKEPSKPKNILYDFFHIEDGEEIWLEEKETGTLLENNPYHLDNLRLVDSMDRTCDFALGRLIRGDILISRTSPSPIKAGEPYYFVNEEGLIKHRRNKETLLDIFNIFIGNIFRDEEAISEEEIARVLSILIMMQSRNSSAFPNEIKEPEKFFDTILHLDEQEKDKKGKNTILDKSAAKEGDPHASDMKGLLRKLSSEH